MLEHSNCTLERVFSQAETLLRNLIYRFYIQLVMGVIVAQERSILELRQGLLDGILSLVF
jgi:hypothetical protein